ncbi:MAG: lysine--tRNA ligase [Candidatus Altiarchaeales archaeon]|nr:lysine--tRNA ligase [Candidatus Altiarchaeales archaeon]MBD3416683.1 lysine--tRNA ligase [Candidatus Altiarchaeales archaeon]
MLHWSDDVVSLLEERGGEHVIATGTSISGRPQIGNASDVIRGDCIRKAALESGLKAELIWISDDSDPFRKVPAGMEGLDDYLGFPVKDLPDLDGCHSNFVDHFAQPFIQDLSEFGVKPKVHSGTDLYRNGELVEEIRTAFEKRVEIRDILNRFRRDPLPEDYLPWTPICEKCGKISTTKVFGVDGLKADYECVSTGVSGGEVEGCGHKGVSDASKGMGKLPWRVEWAARWRRFKVTCEPFGKDHAAAGGSYETSKIISEEVFDWTPPVPLVYEFFTLNGEKISSSKGNVITLADWLVIAEPEVLKYFMYKRLMKQRDINLSLLSNLTDEYDEAERIYHKRQEGDMGLARMYDLAQVGEPKYLNVPFTLCAVLAQVAFEGEYSSKAESMGYAGFDVERLNRRVRLAGNWVQKYGPDHLRFTLNSEGEAGRERDSLSDSERKCLEEIVGLLDGDWSSEEFHKKIYEVARSNGVKPPKLFKAIYRVLIGNDRGPKAAAFMLSLGREHIVARFRGG